MANHGGLRQRRRRPRRVGQIHGGPVAIQTEVRRDWIRYRVGEARLRVGNGATEPAWEASAGAGKNGRNRWRSATRSGVVRRVGGARGRGFSSDRHSNGGSQRRRQGALRARPQMSRSRGDPRFEEKHRGHCWPDIAGLRCRDGRPEQMLVWAGCALPTSGGVDSTAGGRVVFRCSEAM